MKISISRPSLEVKMTERKKFKNVQEEVDWWKSLSQQKREEIMNKEIKRDKKRRLKSRMKDFENWLKSGLRTH